MGHALGDQAGNAVKKSEKKEAMKNRTDAEIFHGIDRLLHDGLSVPPLDIRLLLTRYNEVSTALNALLDPAIQKAAKELGEVAEDYRNFVLPSDSPLKIQIIDNPDPLTEEQASQNMGSEGGPTNG
jgi:hypothetical protein